MTHPTRQEIIDAHDALDGLVYTARNAAEDEVEERFIAARKALILKALPPKPAPTMAEFEWDDDQHYLAEAKHVDPHYGLVTLIQETWERGIRNIRCMVNRGGETFIFLTLPENLTPTGRCYKLAEVEE